MLRKQEHTFFGEHDTLADTTQGPPAALQPLEETLSTLVPRDNPRLHATLGLGFLPFRGESTWAAAERGFVMNTPEPRVQGLNANEGRAGFREYPWNIMAQGSCSKISSAIVTTLSASK